MTRRIVLFLHAMLFFGLLTIQVRAADESFVDQFLGSPLLILVALFVIDAIALAYHKIRK